jgi:hypothetical protein
MVSKAHLQAIDPFRVVDTELVDLSTFTLPEGLTCGHCDKKMALITDGINFMPDSQTASAFAKQIALLQAELDDDHKRSHTHWRFIADTQVAVSVEP